MKLLSTLLATTIISSVVGIAPSFAEDQNAPDQASVSQPSSAMSDKDKEEYKSILQDASIMMGRVGIANIAMLYNLTDEAKNNVQQALTIARKLEGQTAQLNTDVAKFGKLKYTSGSGESHDYWLPIVNDTFVVSNLNSEYLKSKEPNESEEDAEIVNTKVVLDVKLVRDSLEKAATAISAKNYTDAQVALLNAEQSTFTGDVISELPLVTAHDNLMLARNLVKSKDYSGASFALSHAKDALTEYQETAVKEKSTEAEKLKIEISALQSEITQNKPSIVANMVGSPSVV